MTGSKEPVFQHKFFETTSAVDFMLSSAGEPPEGYPEVRTPDKYAGKCFDHSYENRRKAFIAHILNNPGYESIKGYYPELVRLYAGSGPVHQGLISSAIDYINERHDCSDFVMLGIVRLLYQFAESTLIGKDLLDKAEDCLLRFKYWPDEPGIDSMCYWTENHQIMFSANEYLAGQLFPDASFSNSGMTGAQKMAKARPRIMKWLELRFRTGFSEWLSNVYYDEDITALINLIDFCKDSEIVGKSKIVLDLMFLDMALNSFKGCFGSTHGRSYKKEKMSALVESTADTFKLMFGTGIFSGVDNMSAVSLAVSDNYRLPEVIFQIANDDLSMFVNRQRTGIKIREAARWGLSLKNPDDLMILLSLEAYTHPLTFKGVMGLFDIYGWWENQFFSMFNKMKPLVKFLCATGLYLFVARIFEKDITRNTREEVNIYTYRTPDYMLSSAVDYRAGYGGDQQHIWQATLGPEALCFTTHPGNTGDGSTGYWVGSGTLPRVAQYENVAVACYNISRMPGLYMTNKLFFTHAYFPKDKFDEVRESRGWIFGRKGDGYIALYSQNPCRWQKEGEYADMELIADGIKNIWVCETGSKTYNGSFEDFIEKIGNASIHFEGQNVKYFSPWKGLVEFGWKGPFKVMSKEIRQKEFPRYENPYVACEFPPSVIEAASNEKRLTLDFDSCLRKIMD